MLIVRLGQCPPQGSTTKGRMARGCLSRRGRPWDRHNWEEPALEASWMPSGTLWRRLGCHPSPMRQQPQPRYSACGCRSRALFDRCRDPGTAQHLCRASDRSDHRGRRERGGAARHGCISGPEGFIELAFRRGLGRLGSPSPWGSMGRNPRTSSHLRQGRLCAWDVSSFDRAFHFGTSVSSPVQFCLASQAVPAPQPYPFLRHGSKRQMYLRWDCVGRLPLAQLHAIG